MPRLWDTFNSNDKDDNVNMNDRQIDWLVAHVNAQVVLYLSKNDKLAMMF